MLGLLVIAFAVLATGCASTPASSPRAVTDIYGIAGKWIGTCDFGSGLQPCNIVIGQDGAFNGNAGAVSVFGRQPWPAAAGLRSTPARPPVTSRCTRPAPAGGKWS